MTAEPEATASFWQYFRSPFPKTEGFSAYRMPGLLVHVVIFFFIWQRFDFTARGTLDVKGIGPVEAWLLTGKK